MRKEKQRAELSRLRTTLKDRIEELKRALMVAMDPEPLVKGNVYELARKCGKPRCACDGGELHRSMVLSWSHEGKTRLVTIPPERLDRVRAASERYLRLRRVRAQGSRIHRQMLATLDRIERLRREDL